MNSTGETFDYRVKAPSIPLRVTYRYRLSMGHSASKRFLLSSHYYLRLSSLHEMAPTERERIKIKSGYRVSSFQRARFIICLMVSSSMVAHDDTERTLPIGLQRHAGPGGFFNHAQDFALHDSTMTSVQGNQYNTLTYVQGDRNLVTQSG